MPEILHPLAEWLSVNKVQHTIVCSMSVLILFMKWTIQQTFDTRTYHGTDNRLSLQGMLPITKSPMIVSYGNFLWQFSDCDLHKCLFYIDGVIVKRFYCIFASTYVITSFEDYHWGLERCPTIRQSDVLKVLWKLVGNEKLKLKSWVISLPGELQRKFGFSKQIIFFCDFWVW